MTDATLNENSAPGFSPDERFDTLVRFLTSQKLWEGVLLPLVGIIVFLSVWQFSANRIDTSLGQFPGPVQVWEQTGNLVTEHQRERDKAEAFYQRQEDRNAKKLAKDPEAKIKWREYTGKPTYFDQILTSLKTVAVGFLLANFIAIKIGDVNNSAAANQFVEGDTRDGRSTLFFEMTNII